MLQLPFQSGSPIWTAIPSPAYGWFQTSPPLGVRPNSGMPAIAASPPLAQPSIPQGFGIPNSLDSLVFTGTPIATASALLSAVATRRGQPSGPTNDQEIEDFLYDALELLAGTNEVEVRCEGGRVTLTGSVPHKRLKRDVGELAWAIPTINDVQNNVSIATRRRARPAGREAEHQPSAASRK